MSQNKVTAEKPKLGEEALKYYWWYLDQCLKSRMYYKDEQNKLLYWIGSVFTAVLAATGILGARGGFDPGAPGRILAYVFMFHALLSIVWLYYLYKGLNADMFGLLAQKAESKILECVSENDKIPMLSHVKDRYIGRSYSSGRGISRIANILVIVLYLGIEATLLFVTTGKDFYKTTVGILVFLVIVGAGQIKYTRDKGDAFEKIKAEWNNLEKILDQHRLTEQDLAA